MTSQAPDIQALERRLERVEQDLRWWKRFGCAIPTVLVAVMLLGATSGKAPDEIRAKRFILEDADGKLRAELGMYQGSPYLALGGTKIAPGSTRIAPGSVSLVGPKGIANIDSQDLSLWDTSESTKSIISGGSLQVVGSKGTVSIRAAGKNDELMKKAFGKHMERASIEIYTGPEEGEAILKAGVEDGGIASLELWRRPKRPEGRPNAEASLSSLSQLRAELSLAADGQPRLVLRDAEGSLRVGHTLTASRR